MKDKKTLNKMEGNSAPVEQITSPPDVVAPPRKNDPEKVAAGKGLARKNKEAREAKLKLDIRQQVQGQPQPSSLFDTLRNASILVGSALVLYHGYQAFVSRPPASQKGIPTGGDTTPVARVASPNGGATES